ncbi:MAG: caspase family protein [Saprospiraceae bacterium]|nr:caspase family protein [Saprospiraceae bacterium]
MHPVISKIKLLTISILCMFYITGLKAQSPICQTGNCKNGTGIMIFPSGGKYIGQFKAGKANGIGSFYYTDGSKYQGNWADNYPEGQGIKIYPDGTKTEGWWSKGKPTAPPAVEESEAIAVSTKTEDDASNELVNVLIEEEKKMTLEERLRNPSKNPQQTGCISGDCNNGKGIYIFPSGAAYIGEFVNGQIHGIGVCYYPNKSKYQGNWANRYPEGRGTKISPEGSKWTGEWKKGQPLNEQGEVISELFPNEAKNELEANVQSGCISGDCTDGSGIFAYANGARFEGQFQQGKPNGEGTFIYEDESTYSGSVKEGLYHGAGMLISASGKKQSGRWDEGSFITNDEIASITGCVSGDCTDGYGKMIFDNGTTYEGNWQAGKYNGNGTLEKYDGAIIQGNWVNGEFAAGGLNQEENIPSSSTFKRPKVYAVVVGVSSYDHMPTLKYTDDDAYRVYAFLRSPKGGALENDQISILIDEAATKLQIMDAMRNTFAKAGPDDLILLYFSGHGLNGAFLPIDFDGYNNRLDHETIKSLLDESEAKYKICIADACHSGSLLAMKSGSSKSILESYYESLAQAKEGTALIMSSKSQETSLESQGLRQGVFSHYLIKGLEGAADSGVKDNIITISELFNFVYQNVKEYTGKRQTPVIEGDYDPNMPVSAIGF